MKMNAAYCRAYYNAVMKDVRSAYGNVSRKAGCTKSFNNHYHVEIDPMTDSGCYDYDRFCWEGRADNAWDARAKAWAALLTKVGYCGYEEPKLG